MSDAESPKPPGSAPAAHPVAPLVARLAAPLAARLWKVAVDVPLDTLLTYSSELELEIGVSVKVPLGKRTALGVVVSETSELPAPGKLKSILEIDTERPKLSAAQLKWLLWLSKYYVHPVGQVVETCFPPLKKTGRGSRKKSVVAARELKAAPTLTAEQTTVVQAVGEKLSEFGAHLIFGVTGSGKTEIYLQILEKVLAQGKQGLVIVPEISLTPQLIRRFIERFGDRVAVFHSHLTEREKTEQWWAMMSGEKQFLVGARSALFCPLQKLGVIIVDEEHESSFKQEEKLKYNARDSAIMKANFENIPILLGSATPSLESWKNAITGKFHLHRLAKRVSDTAMPSVEVVDLRAMEKRADSYSWLSPQLEERMRVHLARGGQVALFLNRRGVAPSLLCATCGDSIMCPNCSVALTLHGRSHLVCHYCDYHQQLPERCPTCQIGVLKPMGIGTEKIEKDLAELFPAYRTVRADRDEVQNRQAMESLIDELESGAAQIVIGTQMIAKGLDFPKLSLVGVLLADIGFHLPDFRATERSFQLLTQVAGRAGRRQTQGEVLIQTFNPEHPSLTFAIRHDYEGFAAIELNEREELRYPPTGGLMAFRIQGMDERQVNLAANQLRARVAGLTQTLMKENKLWILGPVDAPLARLRNQFRMHLLVKSIKGLDLSQLSRRTLDDEKWMPRGVRIMVDIDPMNLM